MIKRKLEKTYKSPPIFIWSVIIILYSLSFGSAIWTWIESIEHSINVAEPRAIMQIILYVLDIFKWR